MKLTKIGEFGLIKNFRDKCAYNLPEIFTGIGDDAAAVKTTNKKTLISSDMLIEGVHFDLTFTTFYQLGYKFLAVNLSDIFAMGGNPKYFLINLGIPKTYNSDDIDELYSGIMKIAKTFEVAIIGGDTCASKHGLVLSGTLIGNANKIIRRSGAKEGDGIFVTNTLGDSAMGLLLLKQMNKRMLNKIQNEKLKKKDERMNISRVKLTSRDVLPPVRRHLMPEPAPLKNTLKITSMIDISDGLLIDLSHICDESRVGAIIYKDKIPISRELAVTAKSSGIDPIKLALKGGEDYALLFTSPLKNKTNAVRIGETIKKGRFIIDNEGRKTRFKAEGYEHFKIKGSRGLGVKDSSG